MTKAKTELLKFLKQDVPFKKYSNILDEVVKGLDLENYLLDKTYLDISYLIVDDLIINLDEIYFLCKSFND